MFEPKVTGSIDLTDSTVRETTDLEKAYLVVNAERVRVGKLLKALKKAEAELITACQLEDADY